MLMKKEKNSDGTTNVTVRYNNGKLAIDCDMTDEGRIKNISVYLIDGSTMWSFSLNENGNIDGELTTYNSTHYYNSYSTWKDGVCIDPGNDRDLEVGSTIEDNAEEMPNCNLAWDLDSYIDFLREDDYDEVLVDLNDPKWEGYEEI